MKREKIGVKEEKELVMNVLTSTYGSIDQSPPEITPAGGTAMAVRSQHPSSTPEVMHVPNWQHGPLYYTMVSFVALITMFLFIRVFFYLLECHYGPSSY